MNDEAFSRLVAEEVKNKATEAQKKYLAMPENLERWRRALQYLSSNLQDQIKEIDRQEKIRSSQYQGLGEDGKGYLVEADLVEGVIRSPITKYLGYNLRICRPVNLTEPDRRATIQYILDRVGYHYDTRNIFDLMRYLLPTPPVPSKYRRDLLAFGSGDPTKAICSTLVAQAFQSVKYPILPQKVQVCHGDAPGYCDDALLESRHFSHFTPRDFDLSPYFEIVKPVISEDFDYREIRWQDEKTTV